MSRTWAAFGTRVARRVLALFFVCALVPIAAVTLLSYVQVERTLVDERLAQLSDLAGDYGTTILERLMLAERLAETLAAAPPSAPDQKYARYFNAIATAEADGTLRVLGGQPKAVPAAAFASGGVDKAMLRVLPGASGASVWLSVPMPGAGQRMLAAEINTTYLWGDLEDIPHPTSLCVLDTGRDPLFCSTPLPEQAAGHFRATAAHTAAGHHVWDVADERHISGYRELFLRTRFNAESWTVVVSQPERHALAPARTVRELVLPAGVLSLLIAALLGVIEVRRTMGPLHQLTAATKRVAAREFGARVGITRDDEFGELGRAFDAMSERLGRQFQALSTLAQIDAVILKQLDIDRVVGILLSRIEEGVHADWRFVLLADEVAGTFRVHRINAAGGVSSAQTVVLSSRDQERLLLAHGGAHLDDATSGLRATEPFAKLGARSLFAMPIALDSKLAGLIVLGYREPQTAGEIELRLLRDLADRIAVALATEARDRKLHRQAHFDTLTGLPNRTNFMDQLGRELARAARQESTLAVLFVDLDGFSSVNDTLGHAAGDELLIQAGARLRNCVRKHDVVARLGGDEFTVLLTDVHDANDAAGVAHHVIQTLSRPFLMAHAERYIAASIGVAMFPSDGVTPQELLRNADMAMYRAKERGRATCVFFEEQMNSEAQLRAELDRELRHAIEERQFTLYYQPQLDLRSRRIVGAEALVRWQHPRRGLVQPGRFIRIAEDIGLIERIGEWVLREACARFVAWRADGSPLEHIAVNVSPRQFRNRDFPDLVAEVLTQTGMPADRLQLEITESVLVDSGAAADATLAQLVRMGVRLAIDDFGTGYSSLAYLKHLPVGTIKLDRSFIRDIATNDDASALARSAIAMVQALRKEIVAEGVETEEQLALLGHLGCNAAQGYHLGRPMPEDELVQLIARSVATPQLRAVENVAPLAAAKS